MHRLQQGILRQLIVNTSQSYSQLKPADVEGNLFTYHLNVLTRAGLVEKTNAGRYQLTGDGQQYADRLSLQTFTPRIQPRIVTLLACRDDAGRWLFFRRKRQPLLGKVGFPYGKIHQGETIAQAAARELSEKTGLAAELVHRGDGYITINELGQPVSQIMFHLFVGTNPRGRLKRQVASGTAFWADEADIDEAFMPSVSDLIRLIRQNPDQRFFAELVYD